MTVIAKVRLDAAHRPTSRTLHRSLGAEVPRPSELHVVQYADDPGFLLLYLDEQQQEMTDTYHESLAAAFEQARWEFDISPDEWTVLASA